MTTLSRPPKTESNIKRVAILFSGGPAPAANAVISTAAASFNKNGIEVIGLLHGYSNLMHFGPDSPLVEGRDYVVLTPERLQRTRNQRGIIIGTARANPGKFVSHPDHLKDPEKAAPLKTVYEALDSIGVDALISIGGDDTLKTANKFQRYQQTFAKGIKQMPVVHLPKTIDNDYMGIDFTFGYFTAVDFLAKELRNLLADAEAGQSYFIAESMGRSAGWLGYGAAIAGEASLVISVEDIVGKYEATEEITDPTTGEKTVRKVMNLKAVIERILATMLARENRDGKKYGVIVLAEGLAEFLPYSELEGVPRDEHGHIAISKLNLSRFIADLAAKAYKEKTGKSRKLTSIMLGYESRCAEPQAFDVMLGSQLGVGAYRALVEENLEGVMVSVSGQLDLHFVPFEKLVDPETLITVVRYIKTDSDFYKLARFLETYVD
jgi:ATP-dependent phosphofructokinase / diphosphate-dependent phosphofructokinase